MKEVEEADLVPQLGYLSGRSNIQFMKLGIKETNRGKMCNKKPYSFFLRQANCNSSNNIIFFYVVTAYLTSMEEGLNFSVPGVPSILAHFWKRFL